jgi:hypothetical protein
MNSSASPGTVSKRPAFQSALACSIRSGRDETKFHQMWRGPSIVSPPTSTIRADTVSALLVEENEGADHLPHSGRQCAANLEAAKIAGAGHNHCFD